MMRARRKFEQALVLGALLTVALLWSGCRGQLSENPPIHPNWNMDQQKRIDPQEPNKFFKDNRGMRPWTKGTVARPRRITSKNGDSHFLKNDDHYYRGYKKVVRVTQMGKEKIVTKENVFFDTLPKQITLDMNLLKRGKERFDIYCAVCHGYSGNGHGIVRLYEKTFMARNLHSDYSRNLAVGKIYHTIVNGNGKMAPLRSAIPVQDRWAIVAYVRALQLSRLSAK